MSPSFHHTMTLTLWQVKEPSGKTFFKLLPGHHLLFSTCMFLIIFSQDTKYYISKMWFAIMLICIIHVVHNSSTNQTALLYCRVEILEDLPEVDVVLVPVGGGGLIAGIARYIKQVKPSAQVWIKLEYKSFVIFKGFLRNIQIQEGFLSFFICTFLCW